MAVRGALLWLCSVAVLSSSAAQHETLAQTCIAEAVLLSEALEGAAKCGAQQPWSPEQAAALLPALRNLTEALQHQLHGGRGATTRECPEAEVHNNGGLACVTVNGSRYCKPLCNHGYDFDFMRRSRLYDECSEQTGYQWRSQYVGGSRLAVCNEASVQIAGARTAYFPKEQDCNATKRSSQLQDGVIETLTAELQGQGVLGEAQDPRLVCGGP